MNIDKSLSKGSRPSLPVAESREGWEPVQGGWLNGLARGCLNESRAARTSAVKRIGYRILFPYPKEGVVLYHSNRGGTAVAESSSIHIIPMCIGDFFILFNLKSKE